MSRVARLLHGRAGPVERGRRTAPATGRRADAAGRGARSARSAPELSHQATRRSKNRALVRHVRRRVAHHRARAAAPGRARSRAGRPRTRRVDAARGTTSACGQPVTTIRSAARRGSARGRRASARSGRRSRRARSRSRPSRRCGPSSPRSRRFVVRAAGRAPMNGVADCICRFERTMSGRSGLEPLAGGRSPRGGAERSASAASPARFADAPATARRVTESSSWFRWPGSIRSPWKPWRRLRRIASGK